MSDVGKMLIRPSPMLEGKSGYSVPKPAAPIDLHLDANEGVGPPATMLDALSSAWPECVRRYPDSTGLRDDLASRFGVSSERVLVTAGADDAIDRACRAVLAPGRELILPLPTFEMIPKYAMLQGVNIRNVAWMEPGSGFPRRLVLEQISERTAMIAIVTPNNPTGECATLEDIEAVARSAPRALILVDMAYAEFATGDTATQRFAERVLSLPNALMTRTFSKAWGLAGLRVGYAIGHTRVIEWMRAAAGPYTCSTASLALARHWAGASGAGTRLVRAFIDRVREERAVLSTLLRDRGAQVWNSEGNFVFARFAGCDAAGVGRAARVRAELARRGIAVRGYPGRRLMEGVDLDPCLRITCPGEERAFARLRGALEEILVDGASES